MVKYTVNFFINKDYRSNKPEKAIFLYVRSSGKTITLHTSQRINPKLWDSKKQKVKKGTLDAVEINDFLSKFKAEVLKIIRLFLTSNPDATFQDIKNEILSKMKRDETKTGFFETFALFIQLRRNELSPAMIRKYIALKNHLLNYQNYSHIRLTFYSMDLLFFDKFSNYLMDELHHTNNTAAKYFDLLRTYLKWSAERGINTYTAFEKYKVKTTSTDIITLTADELEKIYNYQFPPNSSFGRVRDVFCFGCFTGARFSDIKSIKRDDIKQGKWYLRTAKTKDILEIPLNKFALEILSKYQYNEQPLPVISNQKTNDQLKHLCKKVGITDQVTIVRYRGTARIEETYPKYELVSTHTARRTFITLSLEKGMRPETVMEISGHKDYKTFKKYIKITSKTKSNEMNSIWSKI